ncbi:alginate export family protein [Thalassotalea litorea]|uniref:alginate export family protein n=1 Tax=Thalassotalea litorea TaxID=2020715 RepID=UPI0037370A60
MLTTKKIVSQAISSALLVSVLAPVTASAFADAGSAKVDFRLRHESVSQDNALKDADALTLRTTLTYTTPSVGNFSGVVEFEDSRVVFGMDDYNNTLGMNTDYSVIADPETTELDQGFVQYSNAGFNAKVGRQVITLDNHRFVGHVGWRQDKQTFDAATLAYSGIDDLTMQYSYITQRNRIFAEQRDLDSKDHLINVGYKTSIGTLTGYGYLLDEDEGITKTYDTWGIRFAGKSSGEALSFLYTGEYATQSTEINGADFDADYFLIEGGVVFSGITAKVGYEVLGSDNGAYGFSTPLATLHKFNGWTDQFLGTPAQGLEDAYIALSGKVLSGNWLVAYHDFSADDGTDLIDDFGSEWDAQYTVAFAKHYSAGVKVGLYQEGDNATGKVDTDKVWFWLGAKF